MTARAILSIIVAIGTIAAVVGTAGLTFAFLSERRSEVLMFGGAMMIFAAMGPYVWKVVPLAFTRNSSAWRYLIVVAMYVVGVLICLTMLLASE